jgi:hypothetical protein
MSYTPLSVRWPSDRALILVHGIGDYSATSYEPLLAALKAAIGDEVWAQTAVYPDLYDVFNDWAAAKLSAAPATTRLIAHLAPRFNGEKLGQVAAEFAGDVLWPVLAVDVRRTLREVLLAQIAQVFLDGDDTEFRRHDFRVSIVAHSLGCFHVYEALSAAAAEPDHRLQPTTDAVRFESVVLMASPVQLIRSVAKRLHAVVPSRDDLYCLRGDTLQLPGRKNTAKVLVSSARRTVSLTGNLDPVGGYLLRERLEWAYMSLPGQESVVDPQSLVAGDTADALRAALESARTAQGGPPLAVNNPHDWVGYVERNEDRVRAWLFG